MVHRYKETLDAGQLIVLTTGAYSEYGMAFLAKVIKTFNPQERFGQWVKDTGSVVDERIRIAHADPERYGLPYSFGQGKLRAKFVQFLLNKGFIEELDYTEINYEYDAPKEWPGMHSAETPNTVKGE